ncbi:MAG: acyl-ACP--UDP-N-acetylglucosamine O-acyltransferase [Phycisphaeraceae bacterium]|nr:MAG: acyl-ACP--UDP-N-acetylglucosamine O-acyltransferase [Phycisphaeraceae bacterium]
MPSIHRSAVVDPAAQLADDVEIGPNCVVQGPAVLAAGVRLIANAYVQGPATIGEGTVLYPGSAVGLGPQDYKFKPGMPTAGVRIGRDCLIREGATVHAATRQDIPTTVGDRVFMMVNSHAGHDASVANDVVLVNGSVLAGFSQIAERVTLSGNVAVHQYNRIGRLAFLSGGSVYSTDVPPFCVGAGRNRIYAVNLVGMRRAGIDRAHITQVRVAFNRVFRRNLPRSEMLDVLAELGKDCPPVMEMREFVATGKKPLAPGAGRPTREVKFYLAATRRGEIVPSMLSGLAEDDEVD